MYRKEQAQPVFHRANFFTRSYFISIAYDVSKSDADKDASREQIPPVENALYMPSFQAHQVTIL
jgi:hypothetical protein